MLTKAWQHVHENEIRHAEYVSTCYFIYWWCNLILERDVFNTKLIITRSVEYCRHLIRPGMICLLYSWAAEQVKCWIIPGANPNFLENAVAPHHFSISLITRFVGPAWGPSGADSTQVGPMLAPWTLLSGMITIQHAHEFIVIVLLLFMAIVQMTNTYNHNNRVYGENQCIFATCFFFLNHQLSMQGLTHWGRDKIVAISQTKFQNAFSWMKMYEFRSRFHWNLFLMFELTILHHRFK